MKTYIKCFIFVFIFNSNLINILNAEPLKQNLYQDVTENSFKFLAKITKTDSSDYFEILNKVLGKYDLEVNQENRNLFFIKLTELISDYCKNYSEANNDKNFATFCLKLEEEFLIIADQIKNGKTRIFKKRYLLALIALLSFSIALPSLYASNLFNKTTKEIKDCISKIDKLEKLSEALKENLQILEKVSQQQDEKLDGKISQEQKERLVEQEKLSQADKENLLAQKKLMEKHKEEVSGVLEENKKGLEEQRKFIAEKIDEYEKEVLFGYSKIRELEKDILSDDQESIWTKCLKAFNFASDTAGSVEKVASKLLDGEKHKMASDEELRERVERLHAMPIPAASLATKTATKVAQLA